MLGCEASKPRFGFDSYHPLLQLEYFTTQNLHLRHSMLVNLLDATRPRHRSLDLESRFQYFVNSASQIVDGFCDVFGVRQPKWDGALGFDVEGYFLIVSEHVNDRPTYRVSNAHLVKDVCVGQRRSRARSG